VSAPPWVVPRKNLAAVCEDARLSSVALGRVAQMVFLWFLLVTSWGGVRLDEAL
jgi:hypothetical protein